MVSHGQRDVVSHMQLVRHPCLHLLQRLHWNHEGGLLSHLARGRNAPRKAREVTLQRPAPGTSF